MRTVSPAMTRATTVRGTGGLLVAAFRSRTEMQHASLRLLAVGPGDRVHGRVVAGGLRREVAQAVAGREQQAGAIRQRLLELRRRG